MESAFITHLLKEKREEEKERITGPASGRKKFADTSLRLIIDRGKFPPLRARPIINYN